MSSLALLPLMAMLGAAAADGAPQPKAAETAADRQAFMDFVAFVYNRQGYKVRPWLDSPFGSDVAGGSWVSMFDPNCLINDQENEQGIQLRFKLNLVRSALFELLWTKEFAKARDVESFADVGPVAYAKVAEPASPLGAAYALSMTIGDCVVRAAPAGARTLLAAPIGSNAERAAMKSIIPVLGSCTPAGQNMTLSYSIVRGMIAEPLYRLSKAKLGAPVR